MKMKSLLRKSGAIAFCASGLLIVSRVSLSQTLTVSAVPSAMTIYPGQQNISVTVTLGASTYTGPINVTLTGLPSGITVSPLTLTAGATGNLILNASVAAGQEGFPGAGSGPNTITSWTAHANVVAAAGSPLATSPLAVTISISNPSFVPAASAINLPIVNIDTGGVGILRKVIDVPGTITITSSDGQTTYLPNSSDGDNTATFHPHGNSTLDMPKLAYDVKLNTSIDLLNTMGLTCPYVTETKHKPACDKSKSFILLANYDDKTLLRDWSASALANAIPLTSPYLTSPAGSPTPSGTTTLMSWAPHSLFVELFINGVYEGNYQLIEKVKVDDNRVNITEQGDMVTADATGGYLLEIDNRQDEDYVFTTPQGVPLGLIDPDYLPEISQQTEYITSYVDEAETALFSPNFTDPATGWRAYFDEAAAVNFYLVNDVMGNQDGGDFFSSVYLYKDLDNPLLYMGPIWDFDISSGNVDQFAITNPTVPWMQQQAIWYKQWFNDPEFKVDVVTQWNLLKNNGVFSSWLASIPAEAATLEQSQANNFGRWPMQGHLVWPNPEAVGTYDGEVQYLTNWLTLRIDYLDSVFNNKAQTATTLSVPSGAFRSGTPSTFSAQVSGGTSPSGSVSFLTNGVVFGTAPLSGNSASLSTSSLPEGANKIEAIYSGDQTNALSASSVQTLTAAAPLAATVVSLAGPSNAYVANSSAFTASVIPNSGADIPTGTVTFSVDGGAGTAETVNSTGVASFSTTSLTSGQHTVTAVYSGDANFAAATSNALATQTFADFFTISAADSSATAQSGSSATYSLTVNPAGGVSAFPSSIVLSVSGLPSGATGSFSPATLAAGSASSPVTLTVQLSQTTASNRAPDGPALATLSLALLLLPFARRLRKSAVRLRVTTIAVITLAAVMAMSGLAGCGSSQGPRTYPLTITATGTGQYGVLACSTTVSLVVQ
jgi:CotH kinase protein/Bacterial Ig-like domain (group 3)